MRRNRMKQAERARGGATGRSIPIPLPLRGQLSEAKTAEVSGLYAGELTNWRSNGSSLEMRSQHSLQVAGNTVYQRIPFEYGASQKYLEVRRDRITDGSAVIGRLFSSVQRYAYISSNAIMVDGTHNPARYNGTSFSDAAFTTETDITQDQFDGIVAHQDRPFLWKIGDDLDFYYGDVGAITGPLERFPLGRLGNVTGQILTMRSLTVDAGHGMNDTLAIFTSTGMIIAYEGLNPGDAQDWRLLTRLKTAPPVSPDAFVQVGADLWMLTAAGVVSVTDTLRQSSVALVQTVSRPVKKDLVKQVAQGGTWEMHLSADAQAVIINRVYEGESSQFIYRTDSKSWDRTTFPAKSWHNMGLLTEFTTLDGDLGTLDEDGTAAITARWVSSWFRLPRASGITYLHPTILAKGKLQVTLTLLADHDETALDVAEAQQTVTLVPENDPDETSSGRVSLNEVIPVDAAGEVFQIHMEVTAQWAELVNMKAGVV